MINKTIGIMGTVSPNIINFYITEINRLILERYGEEHNINILIKSINIATLNRLRAEAKWSELMNITIDIAESLQKSGADVILSTNNSILFGIDEYIKSKIEVPVIKVNVELIKEMLSKKYKKVLLLGTKYTMQGFLYKDVVKDFGIDFILPNEEEKNFIHDNIYKELSFEIITPEARQKYLTIIDRFVKEEAIDAVIIATVEISFILNQDLLSTPLVSPSAINMNKGLDLLERLNRAS